MTLLTSLVIYLNTTRSEGIAAEPLEAGLNISDITSGGSKYHIISFIVMDYVLWILVIFAEFFFILAVLKFEKLLTRRLNIYILICAFLKLGDLLKRAFFELFLDLVFEINSHSYYCFQRVLDFTMFRLYLIFTFGLTVDWFLTNKIPQKIQFYHVHWRTVFGFVFGLEFFQLSVEGMLCVHNENHRVYFQICSAFIVYLINFIFVSFINLFKGKLIEKECSSYPLTVSNIIIYAYIAPEVFLLLETLLFQFKFIYLVLTYVEIIPYAYLFGHPLLVIYFLGKKEKLFKMAYNRLLRRKTLDDNEDLHQIAAKEDRVINMEERNSTNN